MKKSLPVSKQIAYAIGQLGWSILAGLVGTYLVYFYAPPESAGIPTLIPQGAIWGFLTIIGLITATGRLFDAITDPWIASRSDRCKSPKGRRISFMRMSAIPFAVFTILIFWVPAMEISILNIIWLAGTMFLYYLAYTAYVTPYFALMSELGHTPTERLNLSTYISLTFIVGTAIAYQATGIWSIFVGQGMEKLLAIRLTFIILGVFALICLLVPVFCINEKEYCDSQPSDTDMLKSVISTFKNKDFRVFTISDLAYFLALTVFQTGLLYYVTVLLEQPEALSGLLIIVMTGASLLFYPFVNIGAKKYGKKKLLIFAFVIFIAMYALSFFMGKGFVPLSRTAQAYLLVLVASLPMAIFGILPNAVLSDIAEYDAKKTGDRREGMFFAARTFMSKVGQMMAMFMFTGLLHYGKDVGNDLGIRLTTTAAAIFCLIGLLFFLLYDEKKVIGYEYSSSKDKEMPIGK